MPFACAVRRRDGRQARNPSARRGNAGFSAVPGCVPEPLFFKKNEVSGLHFRLYVLYYFLSYLRRDGRVVEGAALEMLYRGNSIVGSNPTLSAIFMLKFGKSAHLCPFFLTFSPSSDIVCRRPLTSEVWHHGLHKKRKTSEENEHTAREIKAARKTRVLYVQINCIEWCTSGFPAQNRRYRRGHSESY